MGLTVGEVSLVDSPANEVQFLVTKNLEEEDMSVKNSAAGSPERVAVEQESEGDVSKALEHVNGIVESIAKMVSPAAPAAEEPPPAAEEDDVTKGSLKSYLKKAGMSMTDEQMAKLKAMGLDPNAKFQNQQPPLAKTTKDEESTKKEAPPAAAAAVEQDEPITMDTLERIAKGGKVFTKGRVQSLKQAYEALKLLIEAIEPDATPATRTPALGATSIPSGIKELQAGAPAPVVKAAESAPAAEDSAVVKALVGVTDALKSVGANYEALKAEVATLKGARKPSESVDGDGGTDTKTNKSGSLWANLL